ncbi:MAG: P-type Cu+ transporter [Abditibacteriota bacterium]|nr:P-type Cu+ transporter [Abditibacteriota bacterium]
MLVKRFGGHCENRTYQESERRLYFEAVVLQSRTRSLYNISRHLQTRNCDADLHRPAPLPRNSMSSTSLPFNPSPRSSAHSPGGRTNRRIMVPLGLSVLLLCAMLWLLLEPAARSTQFALPALGLALFIGGWCALLCATPLALMATRERGAQSGLRFGDNGSLLQMVQIAARLTTIVFDRTGTLTSGQLVVQEIVTTGDFTQAEVLSLAAAVESFSEHPLGASIVRYAQRQSTLVPQARNFTSLVGYGAMAIVEAEGASLQIVVGNARLMRERRVDVAAFEGAAAQLKIQGHSVVFVAVDGLATGIIAIADTLKADAAPTIERLHRMGLEVVLLTGDERTTAQHMAHEAGIGWIVAEVLPDDKVREIERLQSEGKIVAMVGDAITDAPMLAQADIGIAFTNHTDIAPESAAVTLTSGDLDGVVRALEVAHATRESLHRNRHLALALSLCLASLLGALLYAFTRNLLVATPAALMLPALGVALHSLRLRRQPLHRLPLPAAD